MSKEKVKDTSYNETRQDGKSRFKEGNPGRPKGVKNKLSFQAAERMEELGLDPLEGYRELLQKARATNNLAVEERALSRLMQFRFAGLHHSMVTNVDEKDLEVSVTKFEMPDNSTPNVDTAIDESSRINNPEESKHIKSQEIGVNVTRFDRSVPQKVSHTANKRAKTITYDIYHCLPRTVATFFGRESTPPAPRNRWGEGYT